MWKMKKRFIKNEELENENHWAKTIDFSKYTDQNTLKKIYGQTEHNIIATEMIPVSTNGKDGIGKTDITMYRGSNKEGVKLETVEATSTAITDVKDKSTNEAQNYPKRDWSIYENYEQKIEYL